MLCFCVFVIPFGYKDADDRAALRIDPLLKLALDPGAGEPARSLVPAAETSSPADVRHDCLRQMGACLPQRLP